MSKTLTLSIIIPLFNGADHIAHTLSSIAAQTAILNGTISLEVIVVDDGSSDSGPQIVAQHPLPTKLLNQVNLGVAAARNRGAADATGYWLTFLDQDDLWHESRLDQILPILRSNIAPFIVTTERSFALKTERDEISYLEPELSRGVGAWIDDGQTETLYRSESGYAAHTQRKPEYVSFDQLCRQTISMSTSFFVTKEHFRVVGGFSLHAKSIDDWWLMVNAARIAPLLKVDQPTVWYRLHVHATSRSTRFLYPLATSLLALKFGGQVENYSAALESDLVNLPVEHLLHRLLASPSQASEPGTLKFAWHISHLLRPNTIWTTIFAKAKVRRIIRKRRQ